MMQMMCARVLRGPMFLRGRMYAHLAIYEYMQKIASCAIANGHKKSDTEGIRTPAGRAQWISSPSP